MYTLYAGGVAMLLYINELIIEPLVSENKIETWKIYGRGRRADNSVKHDQNNQYDQVTGC
jgi:hypothetical protein